jgi:ribonuclease J
VSRPEGALRVVPLGGLGEIGLNLLVLEYWPAGAEGPEAAVAIDCGAMFPTLDTPGIDLILPDLAYLRELGERLLGVLLTHGHEDHIGAVPFLLGERSVPIFGTDFTAALVRQKLEEADRSAARIVAIAPGERLALGPFEIEPLRMTHSIPDAVGFAIGTPIGRVVHTGDFKIDHTPVDGRPSDLPRLAALGSEGVLLLFSDSTNAGRPGVTPSERAVRPGLERIFRETRGRVFATTFSSHIHRLQQLVELSEEFDRRVAIVGRSLVESVGLARLHGLLRLPREPILEPQAAADHPRSALTLLVAGSQGEPRSALSRIAVDDHPQIKADPGDAVVLSARVIPGNERAVGTMVNHLFRRGAEVFWEPDCGVHVSGHASQEELKLVLRLVRPRFFVPVHGETRHLVQHRRLALETGMAPERAIVLEDGQTLFVEREQARAGSPVAAGRVFVDGKGVGDVGEMVLRDRLHLAQDGVLLAILGVHAASGEVVVGPDLISRGVALEEANPELFAEAREAVLRALGEISAESRGDLAEVQETVRRALKRFFNRRLDRRPIVLPWVVEM